MSRSLQVVAAALPQQLRAVHSTATKIPPPPIQRRRCQFPFESFCAATRHTGRHCMFGGTTRLLLRCARLPRTCAAPRAPVLARASRLRAMAAAPAGDVAAAAADGPPLFSFGVVTDVQYADIPDGTSYGGTPRYYRHSLEALRDVVTDWRARDLTFALHLGDILDGFCPKDESEVALRRVLDAFDVLQRPVRHCLGNHCLYNLPRATLNERLSIPTGADGESYYSFSPHPGFRVVMMDSYDVSLLGWPAGHPRHEEAVALLARHNPNDNKNSPEGLEGMQRRYVAFGGGVSREQLAWLADTLAAAAAAGERVFVCGHLPLHPESAAPVCLLWNYDQVLPLLAQSRCVVATLAGHTHREGYHLDEAGIHHRVLSSVLECPPGTNAFGHVDVWPHAARLHGTDRMDGTRLPFRPLHAPSASLEGAMAAMAVAAASDAK